jgi:hypothetical protein
VADFPSPSNIQSQYLQILKSIQPALNINDQNSDFVIRGKASSGLFSGLYGDQAKVNNDTWISTARPEALLIKGQDLGMAPQPATPANSDNVQITGTNGTPITPGQLTFLYPATNVIYTNTTGGTIVSGVLSLSVQCEVSGQIGNITAPDSLQVISPPSGVNVLASLIDDMADGADAEDVDTSFRSRLLSRVQSPPAGGNAIDYKNFAFASSPAVRSAEIFRFAMGLGTVAVYITTGTTDINTAVTQGLSIVRIPSSGLIATVQAYYNAAVPLTDCPTVYGPTELDVSGGIYVDLAAGLTLTSVPSDSVNNPLNLNVQQLIEREFGRVLYKYAVGGRSLPGQTGGFIVASDIESGIGTWLSAVADPVTGLVGGIIPILADWQVKPLNGSSFDLPIAANQLAAPGTITVTLGVP